MAKAATARGHRRRASARLDAQDGVAARPSLIPPQASLRLESVTAIELELRVGEASGVVEEEDAWELVHAIRERCVDAEHRPLNLEAVHCLQLADVLATALDGTESPASIEVTPPQARMLADSILTPSIARSETLRDLFTELVRFSCGRY